MKLMIIALFFTSTIALASNFDCEPSVKIDWQKLSEGVHWAKYDLAFTPYQKDNKKWEDTKSHSVTVRVLRVDLTMNKLAFHGTSDDLACNPSAERYIDKLIKDQKETVIGAINASFFVMPKGKILGLALDENKLWSGDLNSQTISSSGVLAIQEGKISLSPRTKFIEQYGAKFTPEMAQKFSFAIQAYPRLLIDSAMQIGDGVLNSRRARTSIGTAENPNEILLVTIDARGETDKTGMTLYEYVHFLKTPECGVEQKTALNLDGGGSAAFAIPELKIYEQADPCRHLGNILTIQAK